MNIETHFELNERATRIEKLEEENERLREENRRLKQHIKEHDPSGV